MKFNEISLLNKIQTEDSITVSWKPVQDKIYGEQFWYMFVCMKCSFTYVRFNTNNNISILYT